MACLAKDARRSVESRTALTVVGFRASRARLFSFARTVLASAGAARSLNDELVGAHGVTIEQYEILRRLALRGSLRQADLSEPPLVTAANVRRELTALERNGLVHRSGEGSSSEVALTNAGREKVRAAGTAQLDELFGRAVPDDG
jgi:DNA-binding MarR family transcriptional regulator